jgi:MYXO-CTERM domain-containing protein
MSFNSRIVARTVLLVSTACCALACGAGGSNGEQGASSEQLAISGGEPDSSDTNVFLLVSHRTEGIALCSASLIAPNLLLTARHCVSDVTSEQVTCGKTEASAPFAADTFYATNAASIEQVSSFFAVSAISVPSDGTDICGFDIALVTLKTAVPASVAMPLVPRVDRAVIAGEVYSAVGYGQDTPGDAGTAGDRRGRTGLTVNCAPGTCPGSVEADEFVGEAGICSGDSGGPALDADGEVVGVVSRSADDCNHPVYGSVSAWKDWIVGVAQQAAMQGNYQPASWVTANASAATPASGESGSGGAADSGSGAAGSGAVSVGGAGSSAPGTQGDFCTAPSECAPSFGCYSPSSSKTANDAYCAAFCTEQSQCTKDSRCDLAVGSTAGLSTGVCIASASSASDGSSCSVSVAGRPHGGAGWLAFAGLGLAFAVARKRRGG